MYFQPIPLPLGIATMENQFLNLVGVMLNFNCQFDGSDRVQ